MFACLLAATVIRVSVSTDGTQGNGGSSGPAISSDGRYVAFGSDATNLIAGGDDNGMSDIYLRDTLAGTTECLTCQPGSGAGLPRISPNGRYVAYQRFAAGTSPSAFVLDRLTGVESPSSNFQGPIANGWEPGEDSNRIFLRSLRGAPDILVRECELFESCSIQALSSSGRFVAYTSVRYFGGDSYQTSAYVFDCSTGFREQVDDGGGQFITTMAMSDDGRIVAYYHYQPTELWIVDRLLGTAEVIVTEGFSPDGGYVAMSPNGRYLSWEDHASDDMPLLDRETGILTRLPHARTASFSADGSRVAFVSPEPFVRSDSNGMSDVYVLVR